VFQRTTSPVAPPFFRELRRMIGGMRKFARSKWALVLLFIPLVIALAVTLPDTFGGGLSSGTLTKVGDREIKAAELRAEIDRDIRRALVEENKVVSLADLVADGTAERQLLTLEYQETVLAFADKMGIRASAEALKPYLERNQVLTNAFGKVDLASIQNEAQERGLSRLEFEEFLQDFLTQRYVEVAAFSAVNLPSVLSEPFIKFFGETRTLSLARPTPALVTGVATPTDAEMEAWYERNKERFKQPERRRISALAYSADDFLDRASFTDEQVRAEYDLQIKTYSTPETRQIVEYTSIDRNAVQAFIDLVMQGITPEEALTRTPGITVTERTVTPEQIADEPYRNFLFQLTANRLHNVPVQVVPGEGQPFQTVLVKAVTPGTPTPFEQVADKVRADMAKPEAARLYEESADPFRDAAGGQPLEDIGKQFGIPVYNLAAIDAQGRTSAGDQPQLLVGNRDAMRDLFTLAPGQMTTVYEDETKRTMFRLDEIVAAYTPAFADVKEIVRQGVMAERQIAAMDAAANAMVAAIKGGTAFGPAATAAKLEALPPITVTREGSQQIDAALVAGGFELKSGEVGLVRGSSGEAWVARVDAVTPATPEMTQLLRMQMGNQVNQSLQQDLAEVFQRGLQKEVPFKRDEEAIIKFFESLAPRETPQ
jgi:peptidyl-prolyl cis-trans isomerase D